jgi:hypothetical protein
LSSWQPWASSSICKLRRPLPKYLFSPISLELLQIIKQTRCLDPCFQGQGIR